MLAFGCAFAAVSVCASCVRMRMRLRFVISCFSLDFNMCIDLAYCQEGKRAQTKVARFGRARSYCRVK